MPPRQVWIFEFGCWAALLAAVVHLVGHLAGLPQATDDTGAGLMSLAGTYKFAFPGGVERSLLDLLSGFSLSFAMLVAALGVVGLAVARRGYEDELLMTGVARPMAVAGIVLVIISLTNFFIVPALFLALMTVAFLLASVRR